MCRWHRARARRRATTWVARGAWSIVFIVVAAVAWPTPAVRAAEPGIAPPQARVSDEGTDPPQDCALPPGGLEGAIDFDTYIRPVGTVRAVMLFVDFEDAPAAGTTEDAWSMLMPAGAEWMSLSSNDRVSLDVTPLLHWLRMPEPLSAYEFTASGSLQSAAGRRYIEQAIELADPEVDFSDYRIVYIVPAEEAAAFKRSSAWTSRAGSGVLADDIRIRHAVTFGGTVYTRGYGVMDHETSHLFGLPDLYAADSPTDRYVSIWDIMGDSRIANDHTSWSKWRVGWLDDEQIDCLNRAGEADRTLWSLAWTGGTKSLVLRTGRDTAIVAEYRTIETLDSDVCSTGVLVYRVDNTVGRLAGPAQIVDAHPDTVVGSGSCGDQLADAVFGVGETFVDPATGIEIGVTGTHDGGAVDVHVSRPVSFGAPVRYARSLKVQVKAASGGRVTVTGRLTASEKFAKCQAGRKVSLQQLSYGAWITLKTASTSSTGTWKYTWTPESGTYRLLAGAAWTDGWYCLPTSREFEVP